MKKKEGYIYIIGSDFGYKIGKATNYLSRFSSIQTGSPVELTLKRAFYVKDNDLIEYKLHKIYNDKNIRGEWFDICDDDLNTIKEFLDVSNQLIFEVNLTKRKFLVKGVDSISTLNEMELQTQINNLTIDNKKLLKQISWLELSKAKTKIKRNNNITRNIFLNNVINKLKQFIKIVVT